MPYEALPSLCVFAFVTSITPGPSNLMLLASGVNFGFARTMPQVLGITVGFVSLLLAVGLGLGAVLAAYPALDLVLKAGGAELVRPEWLHKRVPGSERGDFAQLWPHRHGTDAMFLALLRKTGNR